jgi:hypothetical protein
MRAFGHIHRKRVLVIDEAWWHFLCFLDLAADHDF